MGTAVRFLTGLEMLSVSVILENLALRDAVSLLFEVQMCWDAKGKVQLIALRTLQARRLSV